MPALRRVAPRIAMLVVASGLKSASVKQPLSTRRNLIVLADVVCHAFHQKGRVPRRRPQFRRARLLRALRALL